MISPCRSVATFQPLAYRTPANSDKPEGVYVTEEQANSLAGLKINISPITKGAFNRKLMEILRNEHKRGYLV